MTAPPTVVVLRALNLGDFLTGIPALRGLRRAFPGHRLVLLAPAALRPLARHVGAVDDVIDHRGLRPVPAALAGADVAVDLHGRGPESQSLLLESGPRRLVAFEHAAVPATRGGPVWRPDEHEVERWCRMLDQSGIPADPRQLGIDPPALAPASPTGATVIHPGAGSAARRWPVERFAAVGRHELDRARPVVITGGDGERALVADLAHRIGRRGVHVRVGTGLLELAAVVARAGRVVCGDTGVAHLATALGTPSVVLHGPVDPALWGPPAGDDRHLALWAGIPGDPHGDRVDPGLLELEVPDVVAALRRLPERSEPGVRTSQEVR